MMMLASRMWIRSGAAVGASAARRCNGAALHIHRTPGLSLYQSARGQHRASVNAVVAAAGMRGAARSYRTLGHERLLLASMGLVGAGVAVSGLMGEDTASLHRWLYVDENAKGSAASDSVTNARNRSWDEEDREDLMGSFVLQKFFRKLRRRVEYELQDDNRKVLAGIIALNVGIWGLWRVSFRVPALERFMWRHFACSYDAVVHGKRVHTLFTSAFSHITIPHIGINMFMLWEFGHHVLAPKDAIDSWVNKALARSRVVDLLRSGMSNSAGPQLLPLDKFLALYGSSALASSALSIVASRFRGTPATFTIGASGAVMGILTLYCLLFPDRQLRLYGFIDLTATELLQLMTAVNVVGSAFQRGLHIDFTGHLGGQATGFALHGSNALAS